MCVEKKTRCGSFGIHIAKVLSTESVKNIANNRQTNFEAMFIEDQTSSECNTLSIMGLKPTSRLKTDASRPKHVWK